ncbi:MAG: BamA/TamA family outer membrane protein [Pseudomonadota bacterium]
MLRCRALVLLFFCVTAAVAQEEASPVLDVIRFVGNEVTQESVMRQEMRVREGESYTPEQVERSRQALMNLGLFKSVQTELLEEQGRHVLEVRLEERYYILPIPLLDYRPSFLADESNTNYTYGGQLRFDNLFGLNQRLKIDYEKKEYVDDLEPTEREWNIEYNYPRIVGTPYRLELDARHEQRNIEVHEGESHIATTSSKSASGRLFLSRWLNPEGVSEGWRAGAGVAGTAYRYRDLEGVSDYHNQNVVALLGRIDYLQVDQHPFYREGEAFSYGVTLAHGVLGSDREYMHNTFSYRRYRPVHALNGNINTQLRLGLGFGDGEAYSLGSSTSLRGFDSNTLEGNLLLLGNIEYHQRIGGYKPLRGVVFADLGNVWPGLDDINNRRLYSSVGVGARWRVQSFVDVTLRLDYAYNTHTGESETYLATRGSF